MVRESNKNLNIQLTINRHSKEAIQRVEAHIYPSNRYQYHPDDHPLSTILSNKTDRKEY